MRHALLFLGLAAALGACGKSEAVAAQGPCGAIRAAAVTDTSRVLPRLSERVVDEAGILSGAAEQALTGTLTSLEAQTSDQFVVVTVIDLHAEAIEDYGLRLGNRWGVGRRDLDNGVLLIVAPIQRKTRIEVGCGLEGLLTNARAGAIIDETMLPAFRSGEYEQGVVKGVERIISVLQSNRRRPMPAPLDKAA